MADAVFAMTQVLNSALLVGVCAAVWCFKGRRVVSMATSVSGLNTCIMMANLKACLCSLTSCKHDICCLCEQLRLLIACMCMLVCLVPYQAPGPFHPAVDSPWADMIQPCQIAINVVGLMIFHDGPLEMSAIA